MKLVQERAAKGGDVGEAVERVLDEALEELDAALAESERELAEADALYEEVEGAADEDGGDDVNEI